MFRKKKDNEDDEGGKEINNNEDDFDFFTPFGRDPFENLFGDFSRIDHMMNDLMKNMFKGKFKVEPGKPFVYGFSMTTGPDGKPIINEFGNVKPGVPGVKPVLSEAREPLVDVMERDNDIIVIAELPGVKKEDIQLIASKDNLEIKVDTAEKKYYKVVQLPVEVKEDATDASYNNGVLEVKLKRIEEKKLKGKKIQVK